MISLSGTTSKLAAPTSIVRQSDSPHTEQQRLLPTLAPSHSSNGGILTEGMLIYLSDPKGGFDAQGAQHLLERTHGSL